MLPLDLQVNGYAGADFCSNSLSLESCHRACAQLEDDGVGGILATVITDTVDSLCQKLSRLARFRQEDPLIEKMIVGFHVEGPFLNDSPGFIGAHPPGCVQPATVEIAKILLDSSQGLIRIVTLAPECDDNFATTRFLADQGVTVSAGHCDPSLDTLQGAIDSGLSMITHLGNGCPIQLPRHDNFIQRALSLSDQLWVGYIPDGAHIDFFALKNYLSITGLDRSFMVTDAISAATLGPGIYELSGAPVEIDDAGVARRPGQQNLAGSTVTMPGIRANLSQHLGLSHSDIDRLISQNPRAAIS